MAPNTLKPEYNFLQGGGQMGDLIRSFDWSKTSLGIPNNWPQSLRTTVNIVLNSSFPMFLFWGKDLVCFYNDAFRPSLGVDGKHPAIGKKGKELWPEIWDFIGPLIEKVMTTRESVWFEDQLVPFYRNGKIEEIYWTFSYSPACGDDGEVTGVVVTCTETTDKVITVKKLKESEQRFRTMAENTDILIATSDESSNATYFNKAWTNYTGRTMEDLLNFGWADLIHEEDRQNFLDIYLNAFKKQEPWTGQFRMLNKNGEYRWLISKGPVRENLDNSFGGYISSSIDITDQINALKNTEDREQEIRSLIEAAPFPIGVYEGREMRVAFANKSIIDILGKGNDVVGKLFSEVLPELDNQEVFKQLDEVYKTGIAFHIKNQPLDLIVDGKPYKYYFNYSLTPLFDSAGKVYGVMNTGVDLTELNLVKQKIEEAEEKARLAINSAELGVYEIDYATNEMDTDERFKEIWGVDQKSTREHYASAIHPDDRANREEAHRLSLKSGHLNYQARVIWKDKSMHWVKISGKVIYDEQKIPAKLIGIIQDITDVVIAQSQIEESEKNLRNMILQAPVAMCIFRGANFVVEIANDRMIELWGRPKEDVLDKPIFVGLPEAKEQGFEALLEGVYITGKTFAAEGVPITLTRNGKIAYVFVNFVYEPYKELDGSISGVLAVAVDVTSQVIAHQKIEEVVTKRTKELADANSNLQKSNAELAQFAYIASHDLQEPLRKIGTFSQMLEKSLEGKLEENSQNYFNKINNSTTRMNALIRDVLAYSELVKENDLFVQVNLNEILESVKADYDLLIEEKGATIILNESLPTLQAIPLQMSQLFGNLIGNALKFARKDVKPVIKINTTTLNAEDVKCFSLNPTLDYYKIQIADNGVGFKPEYAEQIFNIFQRLHRKSEFEGTGIGLAMCKKIAINHQGNICATGSSENGAVFNVILPIKQS